MARQKRKSKDTQPRQDSPRFPRARALLADRERVLHGLGTLVSVSTAATVVAALVVGYTPLRTRAAELRAGTNPRVVFEWPPLAGKRSARTDGAQPATWMNAEQRAALESLVRERVSGDPFDYASLESARLALAETGWFAEGPTLKRSPGGAIHVWGTWRIPVAAVRVDGRDRLVGMQGELLRPEYKPDGSGLKVIVGVRHDPPAPGEPWVGGDVQAGLALLEYLRTMPGYEQVAGVDVTEYTPHKRLALVTDEGNRIVWGGPPDVFSPGQASPLAKKQRLVALLQRFGRIDAGRTTIDVRPEDGPYIHDPTVIAEATPVKR